MHTTDAWNTHLHFIRRNLIMALQGTHDVETLCHIVRAVQMCEYLCKHNDQQHAARVADRCVQVLPGTRASDASDAGVSASLPVSDAIVTGFFLS